MDSPILIAPDKFKGTHSAPAVARAIGAGIGSGGDLLPIADGGEGTAAVLLDVLGGERRSARAGDPLGREVSCSYVLLDDGRTAVVEVAEASGLWRVEADEREPLSASSRGTGELIAAAIASGASRVLLACGGSATTDGGLGALEAFDPAAVDLVLLCDTNLPFLAAARTFAPQKGARPEEVAELERRLVRLASALPHDPSRLPFTGAAGGLAGGLWAHGARLVSGAAYVLGAVGFDDRLRGCEAVVTGEGRLDATSLRGKAVGEVAVRAKRAGVPCHAIVGGVELPPGEIESRFASVTEAGSLGEIESAARALL